MKEIRVLAPWLSPDDQRIWSFMLETEQHILSRWGSVNLPAPADEAACRLLRRAAQLYAAAAGLMKLHRAYELGGFHLGNPGYDVVSPAAGPDWGIQFQVNLLFPK